MPTVDTIPSGKGSFFQMTELAVAGRLSSCESCVEHFYFQSQQNASDFLDSCASAGLLEKVSLRELLGQVGPHVGLSAADLAYDQPVYISAPEFRKRNPGESRRRITNTKRAVREAFRLYFEELQADDRAIEAAYSCAMERDLLRFNARARSRSDVALSTVAKLRLMLDGFKSRLRGEGRSAGEATRQAGHEVVSFVRECSERPLSISNGTDSKASELSEFVVEFLGGGARLQVGVNERLQCADAVLRMARRQLGRLDQSQAIEYAKRITEALRQGAACVSGRELQWKLNAALREWQTATQGLDDAQQAQQ